MTRKLGAAFWWAWVFTVMVVCGFALLIALTTGLDGIVTIGPISLTVEQRTALYTFVVVDAGWRIWARTTDA